MTHKGHMIILIYAWDYSTSKQSLITISNFRNANEKIVP